MDPQSQPQSVNQSETVAAPSPVQPLAVPAAAINPETTFRKVEKVAAWTLIGSAVLFAIIGIMAIWGAFSGSDDVVARSLGTLSVVALVALIINVGARMADGKH